MKSLNFQIAGEKQTVFVQNQDFDKTVLEIISQNKYDRVFIIYDENLKATLDKLEVSIKHLIDVFSYGLDVSYETKSLSNVSEISEVMLDSFITRDSLFIALGGGTIGDLGVFLSSIYMRGLDSLFIPTTMMSQCDSIIGKVAINVVKKNVLGLFSSPRYTVCDTSLICREGFFEGLVEYWKHGLLISDDKIESNVIDLLKCNHVDIKTVIYKSLSIKYGFIVNDLYDRKGLHKSLSLGHTFANYLELTFLISHGVAVLIGILFSSRISFNKKYISKMKFDKIYNDFLLFMKKIEFDLSVLSLIQIEDVCLSFKSDKISSFGCMNLVLLKDDSYVVEKVSKDDIMFSLNWLKSIFDV